MDGIPEEGGENNSWAGLSASFTLSDWISVMSSDEVEETASIDCTCHIITAKVDLKTHFR